ncbi:MAG: competence/damage-inducible protein A [Epsilonproteobacteria bacterium]|nr:competence/damage-inducible protein A [Campylobacterota bacterium]
MDFYALIIGTEILNKRREDKHFKFLSSELAKYGHTLKASLVIYDDPDLITSTLNWLNSLPNAVIFCFGGIGSTPDDYTRQAAATALRDGILYINEEAKKIIVDTLGKRAYPYAINMANLPKDCKLLENHFNKMPGFSLDDKFFFMPGFPEMSHQMVLDILSKLDIKKRKVYRHTLTAMCRESDLIPIMETMPRNVEMSSLPKLYSDGPRVTISVASTDKSAALENFKKFTDELQKKEIIYALNDEKE